MAAGQLVAGPHAGENAVGHADRGLAGRHEAADLGHQRQQGHLADVGALARHVRTGNQQTLSAASAPPGRRRNRPQLLAHQRVVGHELALRLDDVQHRMPPVDDPQHRLRRPLRPAVVPLPGQLGQGRQHVDLGQGRGRGLHPPPVGRHDVAQLQEQRVLQFLGLLVGRQHLLLVFLQLRRDVALGVLDRLLADVVGGDLLAVGVGDLDVVAEHLVEADLQARDARPLGLLGLVAGDPLLAAVGQLAQARPARR